MSECKHCQELDARLDASCNHCRNTENGVHEPDGYHADIQIISGDGDMELTVKCHACGEFGTVWARAADIEWD